MAYKPIDTRRDEFRKYLERTGVLDMFTKVLSKLMSEADKPEDAIEFIRSNIGDALNDKDTVASLTVKLTEANQLIEELRTKLSKYEPVEATTAAVPSQEEANAPEEPMQVDQKEVAAQEATKAAETEAPAEVAEKPVSPPAAPAAEPEAVVAAAAATTDKTEEKKPEENSITTPAAVEAEKTADVVAVAATEEAAAAAAATTEPATTTTTSVPAAAAEPAKTEEKMET